MGFGIPIKFHFIFDSQFLGMKPVSCIVSDTYSVPPVFLNGSMEDVEEALTLGAKVQEFAHIQKTTQNVKVLLEQKESEYRRQISQVEEECKGLRRLQEEQETQIRTMKQTMLEVQKEARNQERTRTLQEVEEKLQQAQSRTQIAEERRQAIEAARDQDIRAAEERTRTLMQQVLRVREEQVSASQQALSALEQAYKAQAEELRGLNDFLRRKITNAKVKGSDYEAQFRELLIRSFGTADGFRLEETARNGIGHSGDFRMRLGSHHILWEVKDYDRSVPKQESEKFQRDMLETKEVQIGVMISRTTEISGKVAKGDRHLEFVEGKLLIYLSRFEWMGEDVATLQSLLPLFRLWWELANRKDDNEHLQIEETIRGLEKVLADLMRKKQEWRLHKSRTEETLRWMSELVEDAEDHVERLLKRIQSGQAATASSLPSSVPEGLFRSADMDEKIQKTIGWILESYQCVPNGDVRLADMADTISLKRSLSKDSARKYILAALVDSAIHTAPGKATLIRGFLPIPT